MLELVASFPIIALDVGKMLLQTLDALTETEGISPVSPNVRIVRIELVGLVQSVLRLLIKRQGFGYTKQAEIGAGILVARIDDIYPFALGFGNLALPKIDFSQRDPNGGGVCNLDSFSDGFIRLCNIFFPQVNTRQASVRFGRIRLFPQYLLVLLNSSVEVAQF